MNAMFKLFELLALPFVIFNFLSGIVSGVWLAILGDWGSIGYGILAMIISGFLIGIVLMPSLLFAGPAAYFAKKDIISLYYIFAFLDSLYTVAILAIWCGGVLSFLASRATSESVIPALIWSYGVALGPWQDMTRKDIQSGSGESAVITTVFAQLGYVVMILLILLWGVGIGNALLVFAVIMFCGLIFLFTININAMKEAPQNNIR